MAIAAFYFVIFGAVGLLLPYLPPYFLSLGFSGAEIAVLGSVSPLLMIIGPPAWGFLADRSRRPALVLQLSVAGATLAFVPVLAMERFGPLLAVLCVQALFATSISSLADPIAVLEARRLGTTFARLRLWGSVGFIVASWLFSLHLDRGGPLSHVIPAALCAYVLSLVASSRVRPVDPATIAPPPSLRQALRLLARPSFALFLLAGMLHWAAFSPFNLFFAIHLDAVGAEPRWIGTGLAVAVVAEVAVMWGFGAIERRFAMLPVLAACAVATALRCWLIAQLQTGPTIAAVQVLHGLGFGAFYVASIHHLGRTVPAELRATGRALWGASVYGLGGVLGNALAGTLFDRAGSAPPAFYGAAVVALVAPVLLGACALAARAESAARPDPPAGAGAGDDLSEPVP